MANTFMANIPENFDLDLFTDSLCQQYQAKGFNVSAVKMKNSVKLKFDKGCGGINMLLGLGQGITANVMIMGNGTLSVTYGEGDWIGKIIGLTVGWCLCMIPVVTAAIGAFRQLGLPDQISNEIQMLVNQ